MTMPNLRSLCCVIFAMLMCLSLSACKNGSSNTNTELPATHTGQAMLGPLSGAAVEIYSLSMLDAAPLYTTHTQESDELTQAGRFSIPASVIQDDEWYVVKVSGGGDIDADGDGIKDITPTPNQGAIHSLLNAEQIRRGDYHVTILSEVLYRRLGYLLAAGYSNIDIAGEYNYRAAVALLDDIDGDGDRDGDDIARWQPRLHGAALRHGAQRYADLSAQVRAGIPLGNEAFMATEWTVGTIRLNSPSFPSWRAHQYALGDGMIAAATPSYPPAFNSDTTQLEIIDISEPAFPQTKATLTINGDVIALAVQGPYIYLVSDGLYIIDATDLANPIVMGSLELPDIDFPGMLLIADNQLYLAGNGLYSIDITDPTAPKRAAVIIYTGSARFISHHQQTVYIATDDQGIKLFDVSNPATPFAAGSLPIRANSAMYFLGDTAYFTDDSGTLHIADVSDPQQPRIVRSMNIQESAEVLGVDGDELYIGIRSTLHVYDITSPTLPALRTTVEYPSYLLSLQKYITETTRLPKLLEPLVVTRQGHELRFHDLRGYIPAYQAASLTRLTVPGNVLDVDFKNSVAYLSSAENGVHTVDVTDPLTPRLLGTLKTPGFVTKAVDSGKSLYLNTIFGVTQLDITLPGAPIIQAAADNMQTMLAHHGSLLYELNSGGVLRIFDASTPRTPQPAGTLYLSGYSFDLALDETGRLACVMNSEHGLLLIDVSAPSSPAILSTLDIDGNLCRLHKGHVYVYPSYNTLASAAVHVIDATDPRNPKPGIEIPFDNIVSDILMDGDRMYVISNGALIAYDLTDPAKPLLARTIDTIGTVYNAYIRNNIALVLSGSAPIYLRLLDLSDLSNPVELGTLPFSSNGPITVDGSIAYIVGYPSTSIDLKLYAIDITDLTQPSLIASTSFPQRRDLPPFPRNIAAINDTVYLAGWFMGLLSFDVSNPSQPAFAGARTSPIFTLTDIAAAGNHVYVADVTAPIPIIDFSNPGEPVFTGMADSGAANYATVLATRDDFLYTANGGRFNTYDLSNPNQPSKIGSVDINLDNAEPYTMTLHGNLVVITSYDEARVSFIDITNPAQPTVAGTSPLLSRGYRLASVGGKLYVATAAGVHIINTSDPAQAYLEAVIPGAYTAVAADGDYLFLGGDKSLSVTPLTRRRLP